MIEIRAYEQADCIEIADLFHSSVHAIDESYYSKDALEAWAPTPPNYEFWKHRLLDKKPYVACKGSRVIGFIELETDGHIDCFYVDKDFQGSGVGSSLLEFVINTAQNIGLTTLMVEASKVAKPLFEKYGFRYHNINVIDVNGEQLTNYSMCRSIGSS